MLSFELLRIGLDQFMFRPDQSGPAFARSIWSVCGVGLDYFIFGPSTFKFNLAANQ